MGRGGLAAAALWLGLALAAPGFWPWSGSRTDDLKAGVQAIEDGLPAYAERRLNDALRRARADEDKAEAGYHLARAIWLQDRPAEAAELLAETVAPAAARDLRPQVRLLQGRLALALGEPDEAAAFLTDAGDLAGDDAAERHRLMARVRMLQDRPEEARAEFEAFARRFPDHPEADANRMDLALLRIRSDELGPARELLLPLAAEDRTGPAAFQARLWLARIEVENGAPDEAGPWVAALGDPDDFPPDLAREALTVVGRWHEAEGRTDEARAAYARAYRKATAPGERLALCERRARLEFREGRIAEGLALVRRTVADLAEHPEAGRLQLDTAAALYALERHEESAEEYQVYLEAFQDPEGMTEARRGRAWSLWKLGRPLEAAPLFRRAAEALPEGPARREALRKTADAWFAAERFEACVEAARRYAETYPDDPGTPDALFLAAEALVRLGRSEDAMAAYRDLASRHPASDAAERVGLALGRLHEQRQETVRAEQVYREWLVRNPRGPQAAALRLRRGLLHYRASRFREALAEFDRILESEASAEAREQAFFMRGWCYYMLGDLSRSLAVRQAFVERFPESAFLGEVLFSLSEHHFNQQEFAEAERLFMLISESQPDSPLAVTGLYWAGRAAAARLEYGRALEIYRTLIDRHPDHPLVPEARFAQGDALSARDDLPGAILAFQQVVREYPDSHLAARAWGRTGDCYYTLGSDSPGEYEKAVAAYLAVLDRAQAAPDLKVQAEFKIGRCYERMERTEDAIASYLDAVYRYESIPAGLRGEADRWFSLAAFRAGELLEAEGRVGEAVAVYRKVVAAGVPAARDAQRAVHRLWMDWRMLRTGIPGSP